MSVVKNQHYVPKFYLRNFSCNKKNIGMFRCENEEFIPNASIKSVAYSIFLYGEDEKLENFLSKFESKWAEIIRKILRLELHSLTEDDINNIYYFILISNSRTKKIADENKYYLNYLKNTIPDGGIHNLNFNMDKNDFDEAMKIPNQVPIDIAMQCVNYLYDLDVIILENRTSYEFITCDSPVIFYNQFYIWRNYKINYGIGASGLQIFIPLSPKIVICFYDPEVYNCSSKESGVVKLISKKQINEINRLVVCNSYEQLFFGGKTKEIYINEISRFKVKKNLNECITNYKTINGNNELIRIGGNSIYEKVKLNFFDIKNNYKTIELPNNFGGLQRKNAIICNALKFLHCGL